MYIHMYIYIFSAGNMRQLVGCFLHCHPQDGMAQPQTSYVCLEICTVWLRGIDLSCHVLSYIIHEKHQGPNMLNHVEIRAEILNL